MTEVYQRAKVPQTAACEQGLGAVMWNQTRRPLLAILALAISPSVSHAGTFKTLHAFASGSDGANPMGDLTVLNGELYGTTEYGGLESGTIFQIDPSSGSETVTHALAFDEDGGLPFAGLLAYKGKLYGTAGSGGLYGSGTVFEVNPTTGSLTTLHSFNGGTGNDGSGPVAALIEYKGILYGTTEEGGGLDEGTIFEVNPKTRQEGVCLYFDGGSGGGAPLGRLVEKNGLLYGTTSSYPGLIFSLDATSNTYNVAFRFQGEENGIDAPYAGLTVVGNTFYGTTISGKYNRGSVFGFKLVRDGLKPMHFFHDSKHDGDYPVSDLVAVNGTLYGTTSRGGKANKGIVFGINIATKAETILHEFTGGEDGGDPVAGLVYYNGALYGTTYDGALGYGTVFKITP